MKTRRIFVTLFALACVFALQLFATSIAAFAQKGGAPGRGAYSAKQISPEAGEVVFPGQTVKIMWQSTLPNVDLTWCEQELYLSLDGGASVRITPQLDPRIGYFNWIVPNTPSSSAVLDIHFGCEGYFRETPSIQRDVAFVIGRPNGPQQKGDERGAPGRGAYSAKQISPEVGEVVFPGQTVKIMWQSTLPNVDLTWCEQEVYLSLDGGNTNTLRLTPQLDPRIGYFNWVVPNTPSSSAVLDIHFGCEGYFRETPSVQRQATFVIGGRNGGTQEVSINSVSAAKASPGDSVQVSWNSSVDDVDYFELLVSYDRGAHFNRVGFTKESQLAWQVPGDFAGHGTFRVVAHTTGGARVESTISAEPQVVVRARQE